MADLGDHDADLADHDRPILVGARPPLDARHPNEKLEAAAHRYAKLVRRALGDNLAEDFPPWRFARLGLLDGVDREFEGELKARRGL